jgi:hypothetical protein
VVVRVRDLDQDSGRAAPQFAAHELHGGLRDLESGSRAARQQGETSSRAQVQQRSHSMRPASSQARRSSGVAYRRG